MKGSHIVVPKLYSHDRCYIFQNSDGRVLFAIPFESNFTLIGTTDQDYAGDPDQVEATPDEISYLCGAASEYFQTPIDPGQVKWTYSGVRPLYDDGASVAQAATGLCSQTRCQSRRSASDHHLRRQDHHLSSLGRIRFGDGRAASASTTPR